MSGREELIGFDETEPYKDGDVVVIGSGTFTKEALRRLAKRGISAKEAGEHLATLHKCNDNIGAIERIAFKTAKIPGASEEEIQLIESWTKHKAKCLKNKRKRKRKKRSK